MTKVRMLLFTALAIVLACGICGQQALAQDLAGDAQISAIAIGHITDVSPEATTSPGMFQGITAMGPNPPVSGDWPCFGGAANCPTVAAGGLVVGQPEQVWPKACSGCGQIYYTFQTTTATGTAAVTITVSQGSPAKLIFKSTGSFAVAAHSIATVSVPATFNSAAVAGAATIQATTTIGTATIKGGAKIVLH